MHQLGDSLVEIVMKSVNEDQKINANARLNCIHCKKGKPCAKHTEYLDSYLMPEDYKGERVA